MTKHTVEIPPDGGYGWVVVAASFIAQTLQFGIVWTVGVFYVIFLDKLNASEPAVALIASLNTATCYTAGPLAGALTNLYGARKVTMAGGLVASLGLFLSTFSRNVYHFYATFGVITGLGIGLAYIPSVGIVAQYFSRRRSIAFGFSVSGVGFGTFIFPPIIRYFVERYGWRSCFLMMSGVCLNVCVCGALFRPLCTSAHVTRAERRLNTGRKRLIESLNAHILLNPHYLLLGLNNTFFCFGLSVVYVHLSEYAQTLGFTENHGALLFSVVGVSNCVGRVSIGLIAHIQTVNGILLYLACLIAAGVTTALVPVATSLPALMTYAASFGFLSAAFGALLPGVVVNVLELRLMTSGYGYILIFEAIGTLLGAPVAGWLYVSTHVYHLSFYLGGAAMILSGGFMIWPWWKPRKLANVENQEVNA